MKVRVRAFSFSFSLSLGFSLSLSNYFSRNRLAVDNRTFQIESLLWGIQSATVG